MKGDLKVKGSIAYVEQDPFIISASVRKNILFGKTYNAEKFKKAIQFSQLTRDIET
jgi:ABC-type multidrug transport system fused ATPase/permease subunit